MLFRLESKPPMPYRVWTEKLSVIVRQWYKALYDSDRDVAKVPAGVMFFTFARCKNVGTRSTFDSVWCIRHWYIDACV